MTTSTQSQVLYILKTVDVFYKNYYNSVYLRIIKITDTQTYAEKLARAFVENDVSRVYGHHGGGTFPWAAAVLKTTGMDHVFAPVEHTGGAAALGETIITGKPTIFTVTQSVGWYAGLAQTCHMSQRAGIPSIGIVGNYGNSQEESYYHLQGFQLENSAKGLAKVLQASPDISPNQLALNALSEAYTGAGRPVVIDLPVEVAGAKKYTQDNSLTNGFQKASLGLDSDDLRSLDLIKTHAGNLLFVLGSGYSSSAHKNPDAGKDLSILAKKMAAGVATDSANIAQFPFDNEHYIGIIGRVPPPAVLNAISQFNGLRVLLGAMPDAILTNENKDPYWKESPFVMVHPDQKIIDSFQNLIDPASGKKMYPQMIAICADVGNIIRELSQMDIPDQSSNLKRVRKIHVAAMNKIDDEYLMNAELDVRPITTALESVAPNSIHVVDGGLTCNAASYMFQSAAPGSLVVPHHYIGSSSSMAAGMCVANGNKLPVIAHIGDSGAMYGFAQLAVNQRMNKAPLAVLIYNNGAQKAVLQGAKNREFDVAAFAKATTPPPVDFVMAAQSHGLDGCKVDGNNKNEVAKALDNALNSNNTTIIELTI